MTILLINVLMIVMIEVDDSDDDIQQFNDYYDCSDDDCDDASGDTDDNSDGDDTKRVPLSTCALLLSDSVLQTLQEALRVNDAKLGEVQGHVAGLVAAGQEQQKSLAQLLNMHQQLESKLREDQGKQAKLAVRWVSGCTWVDVCLFRSFVCLCLCLCVCLSV